MKLFSGRVIRFGSMGILDFLSKNSDFYILILGVVLFTVYGFIEVESQEQNVVPSFQTSPSSALVLNSSPPPSPPNVLNLSPAPHRDVPAIPPSPNPATVTSLRPRPSPSSPRPPPPLQSKSPPPPPPPRSPPRAAGHHSRPASQTPRTNRTQPRRHRRPPPASSKTRAKNRGLNTGKTVGLVFAGFVAILQVCVVAFLVFKRRQLLR